MSSKFAFISILEIVVEREVFFKRIVSEIDTL
jgi:hypothetical protein